MITLRQQKDKKDLSRVKATGEVFTPPYLVRVLVDKHWSVSSDPLQPWIDPCCGDGEFLCYIKQRLLLTGLDEPHTLNELIFGIDLMWDNVCDTIYHLLRTTSTTIATVDCDPRINSHPDSMRRTYEDGRGIVTIEYSHNENNDPMGAKIFQYKIDEDKWIPCPHIVCANTLEYDFVFGEESKSVLGF